MSMKSLTSTSGLYGKLTTPGSRLMLIGKHWRSIYHRSNLEVSNDFPEPAVPVIKIAFKF